MTSTSGTITSELRISEADLHAVAPAFGITPNQTANLWQGLLVRGTPTGMSVPARPGRRLASAVPAGAGGRLDVAHVAWYAGGIISLLAMSFFLGSGWSTYGSGFGLVVLTGYAALFVTASAIFVRRGLPTPGGLMATVAVALVPALIYAVQDVTGLWGERSPGDYEGFYTWVSSQWCAMELLTIAAGFVAWRLIRFPFLLAPVALAAWFLSMDLAVAMTADGDSSRSVASAVVAAAAVATGWWLDRRNLGGEAFWLHLAGLLSAWWAMFTVFDSTEAAVTVAGLAGVAALAAAVALHRRVYLVFGGIWIFAALSYLAFTVFGGTLLFPLALAAVGVAIVGGGVVMDRRTARIGMARQLH